MGWILLIGLSLLVFGGLLWLGKLPRVAYELTGAALLLGIAGYAWQGQPGMAGVSVQPAEQANSFDDSTIGSRNDMGERFGSAREWLVFSDSLNRSGKHGAAANYLRNGVKEHPEDPDLWLGLGNALVVHADGLITPAAQFAFQKAADISPEHPGPPFFLGLAFVQSGKIDQARAIWSELLARAPEKATWKADLESRLAALEKMQPALPPAADPVAVSAPAN